MGFALLTGTEVDLDASTVTYTSVPFHSNDDQSSHSPEVHKDESEKLYEYSGHIPSAAVAVVPEELGSSVDTPIVAGKEVTLITQTTVSVTPSTPSLEAELSSSEIITFVLDGVASSKATTQEDFQEADSILSTTHRDMNKSEHDAGVGSGGSSGDTEEATSMILSTAYHPKDQDVTTTLIPHQTLTADRESESSFFSSSPSASLSSSPFTISPSSAFGGPQLVFESSTEKHNTEGSERISKGRHAEITTRSIRSCEFEMNISKLLYSF